MRTIRIYLDQNFSDQQCITIQDQAFKHLIKVLRLKQHDGFVAFNGDGIDYHLIISDINKKHLLANIISSNPTCNESSLNITLYQALTKSDHMDWTLQKATELGVTSIVPFISERTQGRLNEKQLQKKQTHWSNVIIAACEQSGRATVPELQTLTGFDDMLNELDQTGSNFVLHFDKNHFLFKDIKNDIKSISIICGAEGGFNDNEVTKLRQHSVNILSLGKRVLRTETAAISAISILQNRFGDMA